MNNNCPPKKAIKQFVIWVVFYLSLNALSLSRKVNMALVDSETNNPSRLDVFWEISILFVVLYFIPRLFAIMRQAKTEQISWLVFVTKGLIILFIASLSIALIVFLYMLLG